MYIIYALVLSDDRVYVGMTSNLVKRIRYHKQGKTRSTKGREIKKVLRIEQCSDRVEARQREKYWKSGAGRERLKSYSGVEQSGSSGGS